MPRQIIQDTPTFRIYDDGTILYKNVRFSYVHVDAPFRPKDKPDQAEKYSIVGLVPKHTHAAARDATKKFVDAMLADNKITGMASKDKFFRDGDDTGKEEPKGHWTVNASAVPEDAPSVRGKDTRPIPKEKIKSLVQSGYWGDILVKPWLQNNKHGKKINAQLIAVQVKKEDEVFGGNGRVSEDEIDNTFDAVDDEADRPDANDEEDYGGI